MILYPAIDLKDGECVRVVHGDFATATVFHAVKLPRPVDAKAGLGDDAAVAYAKQRGYAYVMNGEVTDFYQVAPMVVLMKDMAKDVQDDLEDN